MRTPEVVRFDNTKRNNINELHDAFAMHTIMRYKSRLKKPTSTQVQSALSILNEITGYEIKLSVMKAILADDAQLGHKVSIGFSDREGFDFVIGDDLLKATHQFFFGVDNPIDCYSKNILNPRAFIKEQISYASTVFLSYLRGDCDVTDELEYTNNQNPQLTAIAV